MNNQQIVLDINQIKPEALNVFYGHILKQCSLAMEDESLMKEYESYKKKRLVKEVKRKAESQIKKKSTWQSRFKKINFTKINHLNYR